MKCIGEKIKELRHKSDMTQEKLADYLCVTYQTVSKWETGVTNPDLSLIVPIARLFHITTDELLGMEAAAVDARKHELDAEYEETAKTGSVSKRYEIAKKAVEEYPGDFNYLYRLAHAESSYSDFCCEHGSDDQKKMRESTEKHFNLLIENCTDNDLRNAAISVWVVTLSSWGRRDEALAYAKQHPDSNKLLQWCLTGEEAHKHQLFLIDNELSKLLWELDWETQNLPALKAVEDIIKVIIPDGNYLWYGETLMHNYIWQAQCLTRDGRFAEAVEMLKKSYEQAVAFKNMKLRGQAEGPLFYTCPILSGYSFDAGSIFVTGSSTLVQDFGENLTRKQFDPLREREDFIELTKL